MSRKRRFISLVIVLFVLLMMFLGQPNAVQNMDYTIYDTMMK